MQISTIWQYNLQRLMIVMALLLPVGLTAQCAGGDATIEICDYPNPANQAINLFDALQGSPTPGGVWSGGLQGGAINPNSGILNAWNLHVSGTFQFTYTVPAAPGCADNTAVVSVVLGPWAGLPGPNGSACNDDDHVNLFQFFVGGPPSPMQNGIWSDDSNTGALEENFLDATASGLGTFTFTYTLPALGNCPASSVTIYVTVHKKPKAGDPGSIWICETDDMAPYTNVDLTTLLTGQDPYGLWSETNTTGQLNGIFDTFINVQEIYQNYGPGEYTFNYTVYPENPVCPVDVAGVKIKVDKQLDFTGAVLTVTPDICEDELAGTTFSATLQQGLQAIPDGHYQLTYTVNGQNPTVKDADFTGGILLFTIPSSMLANGPGDYVIAINQIKVKDVPSACEYPIAVSDTITINPLPKINDADLNITSACLNSDAVVVLTDNDLANGSYQIVYTVTGANTVAPQTITINYNNGTASFQIPAAQLPNVGNCNFAITNIKHATTGCDNTSTLAKAFSVNPFPDLSALQVTVGNACRLSNIPVILNGLPNGAISVTYTLSGDNVSGPQSVSLTVTGGAASFILPPALVPNNGDSIITITVVTNTASGCSSTANKSDGFSIFERPVAPTSGNMVFCQADHATIANLSPSGSQYKWYTAGSTSPLSATTVLATATYYVTETNPATSCESDRTAISVTVNEIQPPVLLTDGAVFCGLDHPTIAQLDSHVSADNEVRWYDAQGNVLPETQLLQEGITYFGYGFDPVENCQSQDGLSVTVTLKNCDPQQYDFFVPDGFSPNNDGVNDVFRIPDVEFLYPDFRLEIYNRYGALLFKGNKNRPAWDGKTSEGSDIIDGTAPNGVYFFVLYFNRDNKKPMQGRLYLNR